MILTPWARVLLEKLTVTQPIKKFPCLLWNPKVHYRVHNSPSLAPILSQMNPVHNFPPCFFKIHSNIILPSTPISGEFGRTLKELVVVCFEVSKFSLRDREPADCDVESYT